MDRLSTRSGGPRETKFCPLSVCGFGPTLVHFRDRAREKSEESSVGALATAELASLCLDSSLWSAILWSD